MLTTRKKSSKLMIVFFERKINKMLFKPTVPQLLTKGENRYRLVIASAKRARQIAILPFTQE